MKDLPASVALESPGLGPTLDGGAPAHSPGMALGTEGGACCAMVFVDGWDVRDVALLWLI